MKHSWFKFAAVTLGFMMWPGAGIPARAQSASTVTTIDVIPEGTVFYVDGTQYMHAVSVAWPVGSKHVLSVNAGAQGTTQPGTQVTFSGWQWLGGTYAGS